MLRHLLFLAVLLMPITAWAAAPTVDGTPGVATDDNLTATVATTLTTTHTNDIVLAFVYSTSLSTAATVTVADTATLTWTQLIAKTNSATNCLAGSTSCNMISYVFWAHATGTLSADSITATYSVNQHNKWIVVAAFNGVSSTSAPFDTNVSLPATAIHSSGAATVPTLTGVTTDTAADAFLIFATNSDNDFVSVEAGCNPNSTPIWNQIQSSKLSVNSPFSSVVVCYSLRTVKYSSATPDWNGIGAGVREWTLVGFGLAGPTPPTGSGTIFGWP